MHGLAGAGAIGRLPPAVENAASFERDDDQLGYSDHNGLIDRLNHDGNDNRLFDGNHHVDDQLDRGSLIFRRVGLRVSAPFLPPLKRSGVQQLFALLD